MTPLNLTDQYIYGGGRNLAKRHWARFLLPQMAEAARGAVLEVGFGHGDLHGLLHDRGIQPDVIELYAGITDAFKDCDCPLTIGDYKDVTPPRQYDTILFDATEEPDLDLLRQWLRPGGEILWRDCSPKGRGLLRAS